VDVIALRAAFVIMFFSLHVHQIEFIDQAMPFEQTKSAVNRHAVNMRIEPARVTQDLAGVEMLLRGLDDAQNGTALPGHAQAARHEFCLQASGSFSLWQRHIIDTELQL